MIIVDIIQNRENVILEKIWVVTLRGSIYSYDEENFGINFDKSPDNTSILVFTTFSNEVNGETFTEQYCYASLCPYLLSAGSQEA